MEPLLKLHYIEGKLYEVEVDGSQRQWVKAG